jgi:hypothetical protein
MAEYTQYPMTDDNFNFPPEVRKALAGSTEVAEVVNAAVAKVGGTGGTGSTGGSTVVVGGITTVYYDVKASAWPARPAVTTPVWWIASTVTNAIVPPAMADGDMLTRLPAAGA